YIKTAAMITFCIFIPPLGWYLMHKYSTFDRRTNFILAAACLAFFVYANMSAGNLAFFGGENSIGKGIAPEIFREKFNAAAQKTRASNLSLTIDVPFKIDGKNFTHEFAPSLKLVGTVGDDGNVSELKIFAEPKNQDESFQVLNVLGLLIATLNPELDAEDRGEVLRDLRMLKEVSTEGSYDWTTNRRGITYSVHTDAGKSTFTAALR
ncbi:MAG: hypothetical protein IKP64_05990, partial [Selenomonadaceae bacterium]|nr:hypothetical protein [Selenomonadaceae bacterium]